MSRVLVVEDEPAIAELIALNLRHAGHEVTIWPRLPSRPSGAVDRASARPGACWTGCCPANRA